MTTWREWTKIIDVWCYKTPFGSDHSIVDPNSCHPVRPFEGKHKTARIAVSKNVDVTLEPRSADVVPLWLRQKGNLDFAALGIGLVVFAEKPIAIVEREHPRRICTDLISVVL